MLSPHVREGDDTRATRRQRGARDAPDLRLTGAHLGDAEVLAAPDSPAEFAAKAREFQSAPFRETVDELSRDLIRRYAASEEAGLVGDLQ